MHADAADAERALERGAQAQAGGAGAGLVAGVEHDRELVPAEPRERVAGPQRLLQARADLAQHLVAGRVPERVVELLEAVEVDQQQRDVAVLVLERLGQPVQQVAAVAEAGQVVGDRVALGGAEALDDRQSGPGHSGQDGDRRQRGGDRREADELPDDEQRERGRGVGEDRGEDDRAEVRVRAGLGLRDPERGQQAGDREQRQLAQRGQPGERARQGDRDPPAGQSERCRDPDRREGGGQLRACGDGQRAHGAGAHRGIQPGHRQRAAEADQHHRDHAREREGHGHVVERLTGPEPRRRRSRPARHRTARPRRDPGAGERPIQRKRGSQRRAPQQPSETYPSSTG